MNTRFPRRFFLHSLTVLAAIAAAGGLFARPAAAQAADFPNKPVHIIVPVAAGGSADKLTRILAEKLSGRWGQSVLVENLPGASGTIGAAKAAKATPDGYTLLQSGEGYSINAIVFQKLPFDPDTAFVGVVRAVANPQILVVNPALPIRNFQDYVAYTRQNSGRLTLGLPGAGGIAHVAHELLNKETGGKVNYIPYPGGGPAAVDVIAGHTNATLITLAAVTEFVKAGRLRALAVTTPYRSKALPEVPTIGESGVPGFQVESWQGYLAPAGTPPAVVDKINQDIVAVLNQADVRKQLEELGFGVVASSPADVDKTLKAERVRYAQIIKSSGITIR